MKRLFIILLLAAATVAAQAKDRPEKVRRDPVSFAFGVHTGIDIGASIPFPPSYAMGGGSQMSAVPKLTPALGLSYTTIMHPHWSMTLETTYKTVALDAKTRTNSQVFHDKNSDGSEKLIEFRGTAEAKMSFTMLEVPLYLRYTFGQGTNRVILGGYYSYIVKASFDTQPYKGLLFNMNMDPDDPEAYEPVTPETPYTQDFNGALDNWDAGVILGYERRLFPRVHLSGRFMMGFKDIFRPGTDYFDYKMLHMRGTIGVSYLFIKK